MASFADYVKDVMGLLPKVNGNPMMSVTSMTDDNARYMENPFYKSRDIQARDQLAMGDEAVQAGSGLLRPEGDSSNNTTLTKEQNQFFDWMEKTPEGQAFKEQRGTSIANLLGMVAPGVGMLNMAKGVVGQAPDFSSLYSTPQSFYDWQAGQQQSDPQYVADSIKAIQLESQGYTRDGSQYKSSYGTLNDASGFSPETRAGLEAARDTYGYGSNANYYGD